jgi:hypothetical protein
MKNSTIPDCILLATGVYSCCLFHYCVHEQKFGMLSDTV